jgi:rhodanese-related sulfurtransferase/DNA-directed RNA polymerase subunit RPC12/RpoP
MTTCLAFVVFLLSIQQADPQTYVCTPCGLSCDETPHASPGACTQCGMKLVPKSTIAFNNLTLDEFCARMTANPDALIVDVRTPGEFKGTTTDVASFGHFKRAININVEEIASRASELAAYKDREILIYCSHNHRSPRASYILGTLGFKNVNNMVGGVSTFMPAPEQACLSKAFVYHEH